MLEIYIFNLLSLLGNLFLSLILGDFLFRLTKHVGSSLDKFIAGYILTIILRETILLILSLQTNLTPFFFRSIYLSLLVIIFLKQRLVFRIIPRFRFNTLNFLAIFVFMVLALRQIMVPDLTWDGHTYGIARQLIWISDSSILIDHISPQLNLFVNEWHSDLLSLTYYLISDSISNLNFGNMEVYIFFSLSLLQFVKRFKFERKLAGVFLAVILTTPSILGLLSVNKGDLLALAATITALSYTLKIRNNDQPHFNHILLLLYSTLAITSKISTIFIIIGICVISSSRISVTSLKISLAFLQENIYKFIVFSLALLILAGRQLLNYIYFGNPNIRVQSEIINFEFSQMLNNFKLILMNFVPNELISFNGAFWSLSASLGFSFFWLFSLPILAATTRTSSYSRKSGCLSIKEKSNLSNTLSLLILVTSFILTSGIIPSYPWSFRYLFPSLFVLYLFILNAVTER